MSIRELSAQDTNYETNHQLQSAVQGDSASWTMSPVKESHTLSQPGFLAGAESSVGTETAPLSPPLSAEVGEIVVEGVQLWLSSQTPSKPSEWEEAMGVSPSTSFDSSDPLVLLRTVGLVDKQANTLTETPVQKTGIKKHRKAKKKSQEKSLKKKELVGRISLEKLNSYIRSLEDSCDDDRTVHITVKASKFPKCSLNTRGNHCTCGLSDWISSIMHSKQISRNRSRDPPKMTFRIWTEFDSFNNFQVALIDGENKKMRWVTYRSEFQDDRRFQVRQNIAKHVVADKTISKLYGRQGWTHVKNNDWLENPSKPYRRVTTDNGWELCWKSFPCGGGFPNHASLVQNLISLAYQATVIKLTKDVAELWPLLPYHSPSSIVQRQFEKNVLNRLGTSEDMTLDEIDFKQT